MQTLAAYDHHRLMARVHGTKPVVTVGAAVVSEAVIAELDLALESHELVKINASDRPARKQMAELLALRTSPSLVHRVGHVVVLFRVYDA